MCSWIDIKLCRIPHTVNGIQRGDQEVDKQLHSLIILNDQVHSSSRYLKSKTLPCVKWKHILILDITRLFIVINGNNVFSVDPKSGWSSSNHNCFNVFDLTWSSWFWNKICVFTIIMLIQKFFSPFLCSYILFLLCPQLIRSLLVNVTWINLWSSVLDYQLCTVLRNLEGWIILEVVHDVLGKVVIKFLALYRILLKVS